MPKKTIKDWPPEERPRERLIKDGPEGLSDSQLLAIILRTGESGKTAIELSIELIDRFRSLEGLSNASLKELQEIKGMGTAKIAQLRAAFELGRRLMRERAKTELAFSNPQKVYEYFSPRFKGMKKEVFYCAMLDAKNRLIRELKISEGTLTNSLIHPREAFKEAIKESAHSVIFIHNHPSGDPSPSPDDLKVTEVLVEAGRIIGIKVLDHVIIGDGKYMSLLGRQGR
ncbi:MAG: DNA repair protein RadC [Thermodesulfovibrionales bacterium]|nr:DNA repair protein RadC [Thermodesulfovibrionales bacterium]